MAELKAPTTAGTDEVLRYNFLNNTHLKFQYVKSSNQPVVLVVANAYNSYSFGELLQGQLFSNNEFPKPFQPIVQNSGSPGSLTLDPSPQTYTVSFTLRGGGGGGGFISGTSYTKPGITPGPLGPYVTYPAVTYPTPVAYQYHVGGYAGGGAGSPGSTNSGSFTIPSAGPYTFSWSVGSGGSVSSLPGVGGATTITYNSVTRGTAPGGSKGAAGGGDPATNQPLGPANANNLRYYSTTNNPGFTAPIPPFVSNIPSSAGRGGTGHTGPGRDTPPVTATGGTNGSSGWVTYTVTRS